MWSLKSLLSFPGSVSFFFSKLNTTKGPEKIRKSKYLPYGRRGYAADENNIYVVLMCTELYAPFKIWSL